MRDDGGPSRTLVASPPWKKNNKDCRGTPPNKWMQRGRGRHMRGDYESHSKKLLSDWIFRKASKNRFRPYQTIVKRSLRTKPTLSPVLLKKSRRMRFLTKRGNIRRAESRTNGRSKTHHLCVFKQKCSTFTHNGIVVGCQSSTQTGIPISASSDAISFRRSRGRMPGGGVPSILAREGLSAQV